MSCRSTIADHRLTYLYFLPPVILSPLALASKWTKVSSVSNLSSYDCCFDSLKPLVWSRQWFQIWFCDSLYTCNQSLRSFTNYPITVPVFFYACTESIVKKDWARVEGYWFRARTWARDVDQPSQSAWSAGGRTLTWYITPDSRRSSSAALAGLFLFQFAVRKLKYYKACCQLFGFSPAGVECRMCISCVGSKWSRKQMMLELSKMKVWNLISSAFTSWVNTTLNMVISHLCLNRAHLEVYEYVTQVKFVELLFWLWNLFCVCSLTTDLLCRQRTKKNSQIKCEINVRSRVRLVPMQTNCLYLTLRLSFCPSV